MKKIIIVAVLSAFAVSPAFAGSFYIAGDIGPATYSDVTVAAGTYPNPGAIRIAGGYHFTPILAAEIGYTKFGDSTIEIGTTSGTIVASSFQVAAVGNIPLTTKFDLLFRIGLANNSHSLDVKSSGTVVSSMSSSKSNVLFGLGGQFNFNSHIGMRLQYENYGKFGELGLTGKDMKASTITLGVIGSF